MPVEAEATPVNEKWGKARKAKVVVMDPVKPPQIYNDVDIIKIPWTPASLVIDKAKHPNGVVIFNEEDPPDDQSPAKTKGKTTFNVKISGTNTESVDLIRNSGWPAGEIVLW